MSGFLDPMAAASRKRVTEALAREPLASLRPRALDTAPPPTLRLQGKFNLIAEFKRRSPSLGRLGDDDLVGRVTAYANGGAAAVSVLTEPSQFHGSLDHLSTAAATLTPLGVPVMRKDFLVDPYQLFEARAAGASGALLIIRMLSDDALAAMLACANEIGLFVLVEAFDAADIERATAGIRPGCPLAAPELYAPLGDTHGHLGRGAPAVLLGVNCRDLQTLEVKGQRFAEMARLLPKDLPCVAESGIATPDECAEVAREGYELALVGSALMTARDPAGVIRTMLAAGRAAT
jgi:indole-3-glycerol phosphate synthase